MNVQLKRPLATSCNSSHTVQELSLLGEVTGIKAIIHRTPVSTTKKIVKFQFLSRLYKTRSSRPLALFLPKTTTEVVIKGSYETNTVAPSHLSFVPLAVFIHPRG